MADDRDTMFGSLQGEVAVVTGGAGGLGETITLTLRDAGARVVVNDRRADALDALMGRTAQGAVAPALGDVSTRDGAEQVVATAVQYFGGVSILVNVAGGMRGPMQVPFLDLNDDQWDFAMRINLSTTFHCMQAALRVMIPARRGRIVNIASTAWAGSSDRPDYTAAKAGVVALTRSVATQVASYGVAVNAVAPGVTLTDAVRDRYGTATPDVPLGRWNEPDDVASAVRFLCSDAARNISGQILTVAGGHNPSL